MKTRFGLVAVCVALTVVGPAVSRPSIGGPGHLEGSWNAPVLVHSDQAHRETSLAISPTNPDLMFVCAPSGVPNTQDNQSYFHVSRDGGRKWTPERVEGAETDARNYTFEGGDCDVAFDEGGTMYSADTWLGNLSVGHSTDDGESWTGTPLAASGLVVDRPWLVGGPKGTIHITYQDLQCCTPSTIWYTRSTDFGETFIPTTSVATAGPDGLFTWEGNFVVSRSGEDLYLIYSRRAGPAVGSLDDQGPETLWVAISHDSGASWTSNLIASMPNPVSYLYPSIAMDPAGNLHAVFSSMTEKDRPIWYVYSDDEGATWTEPLPLMRGIAGYSPWIASSKAGEAAVVWYGSPDPEATNETTDADWYFYWARLRGAGTRKPSITGGTTTAKPIFSGRTDIPEFENLRLDDKGRIHIGASAFAVRQDQTTGWAIYYQRER